MNTTLRTLSENESGSGSGITMARRNITINATPDRIAASPPQRKRSEDAMRLPPYPNFPEGIMPASKGRCILRTSFYSGQLLGCGYFDDRLPEGVVRKRRRVLLRTRLLCCGSS